MEKRQPSISLFDAWLSYEAYVQETLPQKKAEALLAQTRTALLRYTLPSWGFPLSKGQRLTTQEREQGLRFLKQVRLEQLKDAPDFQEKSFEQLSVAGNSRRNYRWALNSFIDWCKQQPWASGIAWAKEKRFTPRKREKKEYEADLQTNNDKARLPYRLPEAQISASLQQELQSFRDFLTKGEPRVSKLTAQRYEQQVLRILGWLHQVQGVPLEDLRLETLVPKTPARDEASTASLVQAYLQWLQDCGPRRSDAPKRETLGSHTAIKAIDTWLTVAKFVYLEEIEFVGWKNKERIPSFQVLYGLRKNALKSIKAHQHTNDPQENLMSWLEFLELGEVLRDECKLWFPQSTQSKQGGTTRGALRSLTAIAQSYQRFLCVALLSYIPPQPLRELRQLKISLPSVSSLEHITSNVHPEESLLYRDGNQWWIKIAAGKHQVGMTSAGRVPVPNLRYDNERYFYQYLEEWLLHYDYRDNQGKILAVPGLRSCFNPRHDYLFTLKNGQPYSSAAFRMLLKHAVRRVTEKPVAPLRQIFVTHVSNMDTLSSAEIEDSMLSRDYPQLSSEVNPECELPQGNRQWATEIAQSFIDKKRKGK